MNFQINIKNSDGFYSATTESTTDGSSVTVSHSPDILSVNIISSNANTTKAISGDIVTLTFTTKEEVMKLSNFKINGGNPSSFNSVDVGGVWTTTATYLVDNSDPTGNVTFQINVKNVNGFYSITTESTTDGSSVNVVKAPIIGNVSIVSNNSNNTKAMVTDTVTLTFKSDQEVFKLGNFKMNGNNPTTFNSIGSGNDWTTVVTYVIEDSDSNGLFSFQINVKDSFGLYSVTTEATTDGSSVLIQK